MMNETPKKIWVDEALRLFCYDESSPSCLRYKVDRTPKRHAGEMSGALTGGKNKPNKYWEVVVMGKRIKGHWVVWALHHGEFPKFIDHINGDSQDNRIENLREANEIKNGQNRQISKNNTTGVKNVSFMSKLNRYKVTIFVDGVQKIIGTYKSIEEAEASAIQAREKYHGQFARHS